MNDSTTQRIQQLLPRATHVFGSRSQALVWFRVPAMALEQRRLIDLLWTNTGIERVESLLHQLDHGVYV